MGKDDHAPELATRLRSFDDCPKARSAARTSSSAIATT
jgi:hypothetical protein